METETIYQTLKFGTPEEREEFGRSLPSNPFKDVALPLLGSERPGMVISALGPLVIIYCSGSAPEAGAPLAFALHRYAVELFQGTPNHGLLPTTLSGLADAYVRASNMLGRSEDVVAFTDEYLPFYEEVGETANLPSLRLGRIEALLNLKRVDEAAEALDDPELAGNFATDLELNRLRKRMQELLKPITADRSDAPPGPGPTGDDFVESAVKAIKQAMGGSPELAGLSGLLDKLVDAPRSDPNDPAGYENLLTTLRLGEAFMRRGGTDESELSVGGRIREASAIFKLYKQPPPELIRQSLAELEESLDWAHSKAMVALENEALWGIYLCHSRLNDPSAAADALLLLRGNLEAARSAITDVVKRGGAFSLYPHLFTALCETLYAARRVPEMLEAIEASKGRGVADLLTQRAGSSVADATVYSAAERVPELCRLHGFSYVSYLVDDERTYAVLVTSQGQVFAPEPAGITRDAIREAASPVDPEAVDALAPLVAWLESYLDDGSISVGSHLCIAADDDLANVPFACLPVGGQPLVERLSTSRIHNAYHLDHLLGSEPARPREYLGIVVPTRQNVADSNWDQMRASLLKPIGLLEESLPAGETLEGVSASPDALAERKLADRVVHFSTHGMFPEDEPPFEQSGLILAGSGSLPDGEAIEPEDMLTPRRVLDDDLDFTNSHVSMMACVSGLSREGVGGDALGLEWAMIQARASSVLSTHWDVSARLAGDFLHRFYQEWLGEERPRHEALSRTMASFRGTDGPAAETEAWAAFSLTGDWR